MIKKAEEFKQYLDKNNITALQMEEIQNDPNNTVVFRTHVSVNGQQLPSAVIFDNSIFTMIRVQISPQALTTENEPALSKMLNLENAKYKPFKLYCNENGDLTLDVCLVARDNAANAEEVFLMYNLIINYLNESYRNIMKEIW